MNAGILCDFYKSLPEEFLDGSRLGLRLGYGLIHGAGNCGAIVAFCAVFGSS